MTGIAPAGPANAIAPVYTLRRDRRRSTTTYHGA